MAPQPYDRNASRSRYKAQKRREEALSKRVGIVAAAAVVAAIALLLLVAAGGRGSVLQSIGEAAGPTVGLAAEDLTESASEAAAEEALGQRASYELDWRDVLAIPDTDFVAAVDLRDPSDASPCEGAAMSAVDAAIAAIGESGPCGFVFLDLDAGTGLAYNAEEATYIASASKTVLAFRALQNGAWENEYHRSCIEGAILYSSNNDYEGFGYSYADDGYAEWLNEHGVYLENYYYDLYPPMSARSLASIWAEMLPYLQGDSEAGSWYASLLTSTNKSFIRDGLYDVDALVMNKAGWIAGDYYYQSVTDAAIIQADGRTYLMAIVTGQPDWSVTESNVSALARALFDQRSAL